MDYNYVFPLHPDFIDFEIIIYPGKMIRNYIMFPDSCKLPRVCLQRINYWGADDDDTMQAKFDLAYDHFKAFLKTHRIKCSQPPFKTWMVAKHVTLVQQVLSFEHPYVDYQKTRVEY